ncbi:MAG: hypothetical protein IPP19_10930 [Verrucomicrobia bacterium]|nr:hypothetical protein [Verrucomicrobiota bacterium]
MASKRDDYILRAIEQLRLMVASAVNLRDSGKLDQALIAIVSAQEKLFARPAPAFMGLGLDEQLQLLKIGESPDSAREKCLGYAAVLREAGLVYEARDKNELAVSAYQSALYVTLTVAIESQSSGEALSPTIAELFERVPSEQLQAPVKELLARVDARC